MKPMLAATLSILSLCAVAKTTLDDIKRMPEDKFKAFVDTLPAANAKRIATALHKEAFGTPTRLVSFEDVKKMSADEFKAFINSATLDQARTFANVLFTLNRSNEDVLHKMADLAVSSYDLRTSQMQLIVFDLSVFFRVSGIKPESLFKDRSLETYNEFHSDKIEDKAAMVRKFCTKKIARSTS